MRVRARLIADVAASLRVRDLGRPLRVGVDGLVGSGKSTFARELVAQIVRQGRPALHLDSDGFHHPRVIRRRDQEDPARGYCGHAYDFDALKAEVLDPVLAGGHVTIATKIHDLVTDETVRETVVVEPATVIVFDCTFLQRGALRESWDEVVWLEVPRETALARGVRRDADALGGVDAAQAAYASRYLAACDLYVREEEPQRHASWVIDHDDVARPHILRRPDRDVRTG